MSIPLEDSFNDIVSKAIRGLGLTDTALAEKAIVSPGEVLSLREGTWNAETARAVAPVLGLNVDALVASGEKSYQAAPVELDGLLQFNTVYEDMTVNAYLVWDPASKEAIAFDTGADASGLLDAVAARGLTLKLILLTHTHGDHIFDLDRLKEKTGAPAFVGEREPLEGATSFEAGRTWAAGNLKIESRLTWGHSKGGITFVVSGLAKPVAIVGDAVFAGSMGGGGVSYADALRTNREEIMSLPDDTILCAGHGPLTTVGEQKRYNPFLAV